MAPITVFHGMHPDTNYFVGIARRNKSLCVLTLFG